MSTLEALEHILDLAENQYGYCTAAQAVKAGVNRPALTRMVAHRTLEKISHGLYRVRGGGHHPFGGLYGEWLMLDPATPAWERDETAGVVSHESAAACYRIGELNAFHYEYTSPKRRRLSRPDVKVHRRTDLGAENVDWEWLHGMPVTRPPRIIADLLGGPYDFHAVGTVAADALTERLCTRDELTAAIARVNPPLLRHMGSPEHILDWLTSDVASYVPEAAAS